MFISLVKAKRKLGGVRPVFIEFYNEGIKIYL